MAARSATPPAWQLEFPQPTWLRAALERRAAPVGAVNDPPGPGPDDAAAARADADIDDLGDAYLHVGALAAGAEEMRAWLAWGPRRHASTTLFGGLVELENERRLAAALGDADRAARLATIAAEQRRVLLDRRIIVPLVLLEELRWEEAHDRR